MVKYSKNYAPDETIDKIVFIRKHFELHLKSKSKDSFFYELLSNRRLNT